MEQEPNISVEPGADVPAYADFDDDDRAREYVNQILAAGWTEEGARAWWQRPRTDFEGQTPEQKWADDPQAVIDIADAGRGQSAT